MNLGASASEDTLPTDARFALLKFSNDSKELQQRGTIFNPMHQERPWSEELLLCTLFGSHSNPVYSLWSLVPSSTPGGTKVGKSKCLRHYL